MKENGSVLKFIETTTCESHGFSWNFLDLGVQPYRYSILFEYTGEGGKKGCWNKRFHSLFLLTATRRGHPSKARPFFELRHLNSIRVSCQKRIWKQEFFLHEKRERNNPNRGAYDRILRASRLRTNLQSLET